MKLACYLSFVCLPDTVGTNPGLKALWDEEQQRRRDRGEPDEIEMPSSPGWCRIRKIARRI